MSCRHTLGASGRRFLHWGVRPSTWALLCAERYQVLTTSAASAELGTKRYGPVAPRCCNLVMVNAVSDWPSCGCSTRGGGGKILHTTDLHCSTTSRWAFSIPARCFSAHGYRWSDVLGWRKDWGARAIFTSCALVKRRALSWPRRIRPPTVRGAPDGDQCAGAGSVTERQVCAIIFVLAAKLGGIDRLVAMYCTSSGVIASAAFSAAHWQ